MSKFTYLVLCAVTMTFSSVFADETCRAQFRPLEQECLKELGLSNDDLEAAMKGLDVSLIDSCFWGCLFKKTGLLNDKGQYDLDTGLTKLRKISTDDARYAKLKKSAELCAKVQDEAVGDGDAGCERGAKLATCFIGNSQ